MKLTLATNSIRQTGNPIVMITGTISIYKPDGTILLDKIPYSTANSILGSFKINDDENWETEVVLRCIDHKLVIDAGIRNPYNYITFGIKINLSNIQYGVVNNIIRIYGYDVESTTESHNLEYPQYIANSFMIQRIPFTDNIIVTDLSSGNHSRVNIVDNLGRSYGSMGTPIRDDGNITTITVTKEYDTIVDGNPVTTSRSVTKTLSPLGGSWFPNNTTRLTLTNGELLEDIVYTPQLLVDYTSQERVLVDGIERPIYNAQVIQLNIIKDGFEYIHDSKIIANDDEPSIKFHNFANITLTEWGDYIFKSSLIVMNKLAAETDQLTYGTYVVISPIKVNTVNLPKGSIYTYNPSDLIEFNGGAVVRCYNNVNDLIPNKYYSNLFTSMRWEEDMSPGSVNKYMGGEDIIFLAGDYVVEVNPYWYSTNELTVNSVKPFNIYKEGETYIIKNHSTNIRYLNVTIKQFELNTKTFKYYNSIPVSDSYTLALPEGIYEISITTPLGDGESDAEYYYMISNPDFIKSHTDYINMILEREPNSHLEHMEYYNFNAFMLLGDTYFRLINKFFNDNDLIWISSPINNNDTSLYNIAMIQKRLTEYYANL